MTDLDRLAKALDRVLSGLKGANYIGVSRHSGGRINLNVHYLSDDATIVCAKRNGLPPPESNTLADGRWYLASSDYARTAASINVSGPIHPKMRPLNEQKLDAAIGELEKIFPEEQPEVPDDQAADPAPPGRSGE